MTRHLHRRLHKALDAWVDGELDPGQSTRVAAHVQDCWDCSSTVETTRLVKRSLRRLHDRDSPRLAAVRLHRFAEQLARP